MKKISKKKTILINLLLAGITFFTVLFFVVTEVADWKPAPIMEGAKNIQITEFDNPKKTITIFEVENIPRSILLHYNTLLAESGWISKFTVTSETKGTYYYDRYITILGKFIFLDKCSRYRLDVEVSDIKIINDDVSGRVKTTETKNNCG